MKVSESESKSERNLFSPKTSRKQGEKAVGEMTKQGLLIHGIKIAIYTVHNACNVEFTQYNNEQFKKNAITLKKDRRSKDC